VRLVGLLPGRIATDRILELDHGTPQYGGIPLGRYGSPAEFGAVAAFVLSPAASYLTGSLVTVDGGALRCL
jgi:3-oxoacyl-[acyl-carrier protein] reductase